ncbi:hypothetical protein ABZ901_03045 [Actinacidiphila alni]|uniref:hypothetical protein n=1 Tax=Actinacidiphila alni TaxID=380248 RepID=UPI0033C8DDD1
MESDIVRRSPMEVPHDQQGRYDMWPVVNFWLFDDRQVHVELVSAFLTLKQTREVAQYTNAFAALDRHAVYDARAISLIATGLAAKGIRAQPPITPGHGTKKSSAVRIILPLATLACLAGTALALPSVNPARHNPVLVEQKTTNSSTDGKSLQDDFHQRFLHTAHVVALQMAAQGNSASL